ncbi:hypothetical protein OZX73_00215 [Bifidobacterium sp. ESL0775]|uniref:hypothetical protein n=1 Tax=Bifidobacterium sp. ESL0775 TaxID=2983230 RepID=UPI0023F7839E|nr:hypothetical protein [Bifidobacterium sp. ESL0775]WEV69365.1 hypothetical protein OZX73_00215 [Bifidobacterium sp. ESL0775]
MKPQLGDIVISRYTLVTPLRSVPGLEAWKANDRILARDCQLFIVTDKAAIPSFEAIASTLTLSRNPHFTQVIQIQHVGDLPVLITHLDQGLSLNNFLGHGTRKLGYEAMRSIVAETADGLETLLHDDLKMDALGTDIIRITSKGVQIADAPLEALFADTLHMPHMDPEMLAVHELAALLYAMIVGEWTTEIKGFDLSALPDDVPEEFRIICERGLKVQDMDGQSTLSMVSLAELVALLGDWKPLADLPASEVKRPTSDGEASILRLPLRHVKSSGLLDFPQNLSSSQLQFRARQAASTAGSTAAANAGAAALAGADAASAGLAAMANQSKKQAGKAASSAGSAANKAAAANSSPSVSNAANATANSKSAKITGNEKSAKNASVKADAANTTNDTEATLPGKAISSKTSPAVVNTGKGTDASASNKAADTNNNASNNKGNASNATESTAKPATPKAPDASAPVPQDKSNKWWRQRGRNRNEEQVNLDSGLDGEGTVPRMDIHDLTAAEMADAFKSFDSTADDSIFPDFGPGTTQNTNPTMQFDFALKPNGDAPHVDGPMNRTEATGRIPLLDTDGNLIEPGHESAQALEAEQEAIAAANPAITPPSFTPQHNGQAAQTGNPTDDDIADTPLFGKLKTKVVAIIVVVVLIIAAAGVAAYELISHNQAKPSAGTTSSQSSSNPWPDIDVNKVPFGAQGNGSESENGGESGTSGESGKSADTSKQGKKGSGSSSKSGEKSGASSKVSNADKIAKAVPAPSIPVNNTPLTIDKQEFYHNPAGQNGLAYYMHLSSPAAVTRFEVQIRTSGGTGYLIANTAQDPNAGQQVAQFTFDQSGTTEVKLQKPVNSQDFLLWVPMDSLPNHSLYIQHVQLF